MRSAERAAASDTPPTQPPTRIRTDCRIWLSAPTTSSAATTSLAASPAASAASPASSASAASLASLTASAASAASPPLPCSSSAAGCEFAGCGRGGWKWGGGEDGGEDGGDGGGGSRSPQIRWPRARSDLHRPPRLAEHASLATPPVATRLEKRRHGSSSDARRKPSANGSTKLTK